jgi:phosphatidylglycerophosphate synthase
MTVVVTAIIALAAYVFATFLFIVITQLSLLPQGPLWDPSFRGPLIFMMLIVVFAVLLVPLFMREVDPAVRTLSGLTVLALVVYAAFHHVPAFDPERPMRFIVSHVFTPFRIWSGGR